MPEEAQLALGATTDFNLLDMLFLVASQALQPRPLLSPRQLDFANIIKE